jgi:GNAT superfamily N-acetyltransferase
MTPQELLARAFHEDPFISWAEPDPARRPRTMARVFGGMLAYAHRCGGSLYEPGVGSVDWRDATAAHMGPFSVATSGTWRVALVAPPAVWLRLSAHEDAAMARVQRFLVPGSVYLCTLGVDPSVAGKGHGSALLQRAFTEQATRWSTCVLRTEQPRNVPFYLKNGFDQVDEFVVKASGLRTWVFSRPLSAGGVARPSDVVRREASPR